MTGSEPSIPLETFEPAMAWSRADALAMERRHVAEGERRCERQMALIARLRQHGLDIAEAEQFLVHLTEFVQAARVEVTRHERQDR